MTLNKLAFVDIETSGSSIRYDRIIEIGIVKVKNNECVDTFTTLLNPQTYVSPFIEQMTGIKTAELERAPTFEEMADMINTYLEDYIFVAHNVRFDLGFLKNEFRRYGLNFSPKHFCSVKLSRSLFPNFRHHNLDSIIERFAIDCPRRHRALDDAQVIWQFFQKLHRQFSSDAMTQHISKLLKKPSLPTQLSVNIPDKLPETPGVYIFYGENNIPLYIGKSVNVRERILNHFSSDHTSSKEMNMCQQIKHIETIETAGELGALLTESSLIKKMQPLFNRQLRISRQMYVLKQYADERGYLRVKLQETGSIEQDEFPHVIGMFRAKRQVKDFLRHLVKEYSLCEKLLELEKGKGACFSYKLGICQGACLKEEKPIKYNMRFIQAFSKTKIKSWPFKGPIAIYEEDEFTGKTQRFIIDNWCLLNEDSTAEFDYDTYKILVRYILNEKNIKKIKLIRATSSAASASPTAT